MKYFSFSSKLSMFYEIISQASYDIIFFVLMFFIIIIAYSLAGNILFGVTDPQFSTFHDSVMTMMLMIIGALTSMDIVSFHDTIEHVFGISFVIANVLLLNMFVAIIGSHYFEYYVEQGDTNISSFRLLVNALFGEYEHEVSQESGFFTKRKNNFIMWLKRWANNIIEDEIVIIDPNSCKYISHSFIIVKPTHLENQEGELCNKIDPALAARIDATEKEEEEDILQTEQLEESQLQTHFWYLLLEKQLNRIFGGNFFNEILKPEKCLELEKNFHCGGNLLTTNSNR